MVENYLWDDSASFKSSINLIEDKSIVSFIQETALKNCNIVKLKLSGYKKNFFVDILWKKVVKI